MRELVTRLCLAIALGLALSEPALAAERPNILVIRGDDIGITNTRSGSRVVVGSRRPDVARIAFEKR